MNDLSAGGTYLAHLLPGAIDDAIRFGEGALLLGAEYLRTGSLAQGGMGVVDYVKSGRFGADLDSMPVLFGEPDEPVAKVGYQHGPLVAMGLGGPVTEAAAYLWGATKTAQVSRTVSNLYGLEKTVFVDGFLVERGSGSIHYGFVDALGRPTLHYRQHVPFVEIANLLGVTKGRVSQIHRAAVDRMRAYVHAPDIRSTKA